MKKEKSLPLPGIAAFQTRARGNEGQKLPLTTAEGELTAHWLLVRSIDSDAYQAASMEAAQLARETVGIADPKAQAAHALDSICQTLAALVADWSFADRALVTDEANFLPCTPENVTAFLREAPQIRDMLDQFSRRRAAFYRRQRAGS